MDEEIVTLEAYSDPLEAEWVKGRLESEGIRVFQSGEATTSLFAGLGGAFSKVQLHVTLSDLARARCILQRLDDEEDEHEDQPDAEEEVDTRIRRRNPPAEPADPEKALQTSRNPTAEDIREGPSVAPAPVPAAGPVDEAEGPTVSWTADDYAHRAFLSAFLGMIICFLPLHLYSAWLLFRLMNADDELSPAGMRKLYVALIIDVIVLGAVVMFLASMVRAFH
jgi:hypothetical protein